MTTFRLELLIPSPVPRPATHTFYWPNDGRGSFLAPGLDAYLHLLGPVRDANVEFVRLAVAVFAADRSTPRRMAQTNWSRRHFEIVVPMYNPTRWEAVRDDLESIVGFLTGDQWSFRFVQDETPRLAPVSYHAGVSRVVLLSGGADSAIGALLARHSDPVGLQALVSHVSATSIAPVQRSLVRAIEAVQPGPSFRHHQFHLSRRRKQVGGATFPHENSSRSRSLLFLSLGLAVASIERVQLSVPENGFASLNPALSPDQRGSLSTKTTHPAYLDGLKQVLGVVGAHADLVNPFAMMTKGEMFQEAADLLGSDRASKLLSTTHSCSHTGQRSLRIPVTAQCGVCFGCLVRRSAFLAANLQDVSNYMLNSTDERVLRTLADWSAESSMRSFIDQNFDAAAIAGLSLPRSFPPSAAADLCRRAAREFGALLQ